MFQKVEVFNNPGKRLFNVRDYYDKTIVHRDEVLILQPDFVIDEALQRQFLETKELTQHAYVVGYLLDHNLKPKQTAHEDWQQIRYNPYIHSSFVDLKGRGVLRAGLAQLRLRHGKAIVFAKGVIYAGQERIPE